MTTSIVDEASYDSRALAADLFAASHDFVLMVTMICVSHTSVLNSADWQEEELERKRDVASYFEQVM